MIEKTLIVFVKNPELGNAKSRIAEEVGAEKALDIYNQLLDITRSNVLKCTCEKVVYYSDYININDNWRNDAFDKKKQSGEILGDKMYNAIKDELHHSDKVVLIGSDCPSLTPDIIGQAFTELDTVDYTFGPSVDGGYYLVGARMNHSGPFTGINWSTSHVLAQTIHILKQLEFSYSLLPVLNDIDHWSDWVNYISNCQ